jgi:hypothetical protein
MPFSVLLSASEFHSDLFICMNGVVLKHREGISCAFFLFFSALSLSLLGGGHIHLVQHSTRSELASGFVIA